LFNGWPTFLYELIIKAIWPRRLIVLEGYDDIVNLFMRELLLKVPKVIMTLDERGWVSIDEVRVPKILTSFFLKRKENIINLQAYSSRPTSYPDQSSQH